MLQRRLSEALLDALQQLKGKADDQMARQTIARCLRTYAFIDLAHVAEPHTRKICLQHTC